MYVKTPEFFRFSVSKVLEIRLIPAYLPVCSPMMVGENVT